MQTSIRNDINSVKSEKPINSKFQNNPNKNIEYKIVENFQKEEYENSNKLPNKKQILSPKFSQILYYIILLISYIALNYFIKPVSTLLDLIFLTDIVIIKEIPTEENGNSTQSINNLISLIGWILIFILPLYNLFTTGIKIIGIHKSILSRIYATIILLIEIILNLPLTFLYESNLYSIYLFEETRYKQLLNPWIVFYPTIYTESIFEISRNFIVPAYFFIIAKIKYDAIKNDTTETFLMIILIIQISLCIMRFIGSIVLTIKKVREKMLVKDKKKKN